MFKNRPYLKPTDDHRCVVYFQLCLQVSSSLPKTSYFKLVDVWLLFCIFATFLIIVFHIIIDLILNEEKNSTKGLPGHMILVGRSAVAKDHTNEGPAFRAWATEGSRTPSPRLPGWRQRVTVKGVERFARWFMAAVFLVFSVFYWMTAYKLV